MISLKTRIWDGKDMRFFNDPSEWDIEDYDEFMKLTGHPRMLFTGQQDKFGEDIYEDDFLRSVKAHAGGTFLCVVSFCVDDSGFEAMPVGCKGEPWRLASLNPRFWKISGNTHEGVQK